MYFVFIYVCIILVRLNRDYNIFCRPMVSDESSILKTHAVYDDMLDRILCFCPIFFDEESFRLPV